jgi:hypothetical protein
MDPIAYVDGSDASSIVPVLMIFWMRSAVAEHSLAGLLRIPLQPPLDSIRDRPIKSCQRLRKLLHLPGKQEGKSCSEISINNDVEIHDAHPLCTAAELLPAAAVLGRRQEARLRSPVQIATVLPEEPYATPVPDSIRTVGSAADRL